MDHGKKLKTGVAFTATKNIFSFIFCSNCRISLNICFDAEYFNSRLRYFLKWKKKLTQFWIIHVSLTCIDQIFTVINDLKHCFHFNKDYYQSENLKDGRSTHINGLGVFGNCFSVEHCVHQIANDVPA